MSEKQQVLPFDPIYSYFMRPEYTDSDLAVAIGVERTAVQRWLKQGIRFYVADKLVTRLGYHPSYFWPEEYWQVSLGGK